MHTLDSVVLKNLKKEKKKGDLDYDVFILIKNINQINKIGKFRLTVKM